MSGRSLWCWVQATSRWTMGIKQSEMVRVLYNPIDLLCNQVSTLPFILKNLCQKVWNCCMHNKCMGLYRNLTSDNNFHGSWGKSRARLWLSILPLFVIKAQSKGLEKNFIPACPLGKQLSHFACPGPLLALLSYWFS